MQASCILTLVWAVAAPMPGDRLPPASAPSTPADVRIMTFNIRYGTANDGENRWENRREMAFEIIRRHKPDILGLQEALRFQIDEIREAVPGLEEVGVGRDDGKAKGEFSVILYRRDRFKLGEHGTFWLSDTPEVPGSKHWGNSITRVCTWARFLEAKGENADRAALPPGPGFYVFNTHLDHQSQPAREKGIRLILKRIGARSHPEPFVLTGDFNAGEDNPTLAFAKGMMTSTAPAAGLSATSAQARLWPRLVDTFRVAYPDEKVVGTFNGFEGRTTGDKIDYILVPPGIKVREAEIIRDHRGDRYPSDHFPLIATLELRPSATQPGGR
ncbi:MAG: endonuclease/exonuclease/phosphatase family protein [Phycisphaerae bacterium]|nr:endonuclease/exonuclease/phosphatase family protein [Phycisphaerae bacterium]